MMIRNIIAIGLLTSIAFSSDYFVQTNVGYYDGMAKSTSNSADDNTIIPSVELGMKGKSYNFYLSYDQIKWNDAKAQDAMVNIDYVIPSNSIDYYLGLGVGKMKYEVEDISSKAVKENVASIKAGINYDLSKSFYVNTGLRYLYTNDIEVKDTTNNVYSKLDNFTGLEVGIGLKF
jgi:hemolysin activation/secretion protein